jgi:hypothetical protein
MTVTLGDPVADIRKREMQRAHIDISRDLEGDPVVFACFDLRHDEVVASRHAVEAVAAERYRMSSMSADDVVELRELTALADELTGGMPVEMLDGSSDGRDGSLGGEPAAGPTRGEPGAGPARGESDGGSSVTDSAGLPPEELDKVMRTIVLRPARLTLFRAALAQFVESRDEAEWIRDDDRDPLAIVRGMLFPLEQLCHEALRAALSPESRAY